MSQTRKSTEQVRIRGLISRAVRAQISGHPGVPPGIPGGTPGHPGGPRGTSRYTGDPRGTPAGVPRATPRYPGVPRVGQETKQDKSMQGSRSIQGAGGTRQYCSVPSDGSGRYTAIWLCPVRRGHTVHGNIAVYCPMRGGLYTAILPCTVRWFAKSSGSTIEQQSVN
jgi:hypothetical protein